MKVARITLRRGCPEQHRMLPFRSHLEEREDDDEDEDMSALSRFDEVAGEN